MKHYRFLALAIAFAIAPTITACHHGDDVTGVITDKPIVGPKDTTTGEPTIGGVSFSKAAEFQIFSGSADRFIGLNDSTFLFTSGNTGRMIRRRKDSAGKITMTTLRDIPLTSTNGPIALSNDGKLAVRRGQIQTDVIDANTGNLLFTINAQEQMNKGTVTGLGFSPDSKSLVITDDTRTAYIYDIPTQTFVAVRDSTSTSGTATMVSWNPNNAMFVLGGVTQGTNSNGIVLVNKNGSTTNQYYPVFGARRPITSVNWGKWICATAQDSTLKIYDPGALPANSFREKTSKLLPTIATSCYSGLNSDYVADGYDNGRIDLYKVGSPTTDLIWRSDTFVHTGAVAGIFLTSDGYIISAGKDGRVVFTVSQK